MIYATITLEAGTTPRGVFDADVPSTNQVPCEVRPVTRSEVYQARAVGYNPTVVFRLRIAEDYNGEQTVIYDGNRYRVVRTYQQGFGIEIVCEEATYNAATQSSAGSNAADV